MEVLCVEVDESGGGSEWRRVRVEVGQSGGGSEWRWVAYVDAGTVEVGRSEGG